MAAEGTQALLRVLGILKCFLDDDPSRYTLSEIAAKTGLTTPTAHRMLKTLVEESFLARDDRSSTYQLGPVVAQLARKVLRASPQDLLIPAVPVLERLRALTNETVGLHCSAGRERLCLAELESRQSIRMATGIGRAHPIHAGAAGKVLLAWGGPSAVPDLLAGGRLTSLTAGTITDPSCLVAELELVRSRGYAVSHGEVVEGAASLAAPVLDASGLTVAAIYITGPSFRLTDARLADCVPALLDSAQEIRVGMGITDGERP